MEVSDARSLALLVRSIKLMSNDSLDRVLSHNPSLRPLLKRLCNISLQLQPGDLRNQIPDDATDKTVEHLYYQRLLDLDRLARLDQGAVRLLARSGLEIYRCPCCDVGCRVTTEAHPPGVN
jgi:hypothetical protein